MVTTAADLVQRSSSEPDRRGFTATASAADGPRPSTSDGSVADVWGPGRTVFPGLGSSRTPGPASWVVTSSDVVGTLGIEAAVEAGAELAVEPAVEPAMEAADVVVVPPRRRGWRGLARGRWPSATSRGHRAGVVGAVGVAVLALLVMTGFALTSHRAVVGTPTVARRSVPAALPATPGDRGRTSAPSSVPSASGRPHSSLPPSALVNPSHLAPARTPGSVASSPAPGSSSHAAGNGTAASGSAPETTAEAAAVAASWQTTRGRALAAGNRAALETVETGPALDGDLASVGTTPPTLRLATEDVLSAATYPRSFVAVFAGGAGSEVSEALVAFEQTAAGGPWLADLDVTVPTTQVPSAPTTGSQSVPVGASILGTLASAWQQWAATGQRPMSASGPTIADTGAYQQVGAASAEQVAVAALAGRHAVVQFAALPGAVAVPMATASGVCGAVAETVVLTGDGGHPLVQPPDRSALGVAVVPGSYASVTERSVVQVCAAGVGSAVEVVGSGSTPFATATVPA